MVEFAVERYVSRTDATAVRRTVEPARTAAVGAVADRAGLRARVVEAAAL
jgi:hypothetical protein